MQKPGLFGMSGFLLFLLTCCSFTLKAQQVGNLVLIDADNKTPFTVRIGDQLFASTSHGHLAIPHLKDSSYKLGIGFPKKAITEQIFPIQLKQKDLGFQLQGSDGNWVLYNWQTKATIHPVRDRDSSRILEMGVKRDDGFSKLMAAVVDDTAVMYNTYTGNWFTRDSLSQLPSTALTSTPASVPGSGLPGQPSAKSPDSTTISKTNLIPPAVVAASKTIKQPAPGIKVQSKPADSTLAKTDKPLVVSPSVSAPVVKANLTSARQGVKKIREVNLKISRKMVFLDAGSDGQVDTVTVFVFYESRDSIKKQAAGVAGVKKKQAASDSTATADVQSKTSGADVFIRGCGEQATTADLEWLRSAVLKANTEQDKISAASTAFALKCFSVSQLRILAGLFVSDKARYRLMEAAKLHISDKDHFRELADMYTDKNFQKKFLVMADKKS